MREVQLNPNWETILVELSEVFCFEFDCVGTTENPFNGKTQNIYTLTDICFARKSDLDDFIEAGTTEKEQYSRASVLYSLYACNYLKVGDIKYPTYQNWKQNHPGMTLDHQLPRYWFPRYTFDCDNWKPLSREDNQDKGDDFLDEGIEKLESLAAEIRSIKAKYT